MSNDEKVANLEKEVSKLGEQVAKLTASLIEYKNNHAKSNAVIEDLKKQLASVSGRLGLNKVSPKSRTPQVRTPGPIGNNRPIVRPGR